jgi:hypothetical protein
LELQAVNNFEGIDPSMYHFFIDVSADRWKDKTFDIGSSYALYSRFVAEGKEQGEAVEREGLIK